MYVVQNRFDGIVLHLTLTSGAGPGGLTLAVALAKFSDPRCPVVVDLYECQPRIGTVGAGLSIWPRTRTPLTELGLMQHLQGELNSEAEEGRGD